MEPSKKCTCCKTIKPLSEFSAHFKAKDGKQSHCKSCVAERARGYRKGRPCVSCGKPKEEGVPKGARLCLACAESCSVCKTNPRKPRARLCSKCQAEYDKKRKNTGDAKLKDKITRIASKFQVRRPLAAVLAVTNTCAACGETSQIPGRMHVDHCHKNGEVRGVLCFNCNAALGHVGDSIERLEKLISYLNTVKETVYGLEDLKKARHFIDLLIELECSRNLNKVE